MTYPSSETDNNNADTQGQNYFPVETPQDEINGTGGETQHPWSGYMEELPESVRPLVEPIFKKWEGDVTQRFQKVHSDYEPIKGFKEVVENGWDLNDVQSALQLAAAINENPQAVYEAMRQSLNIETPSPEQGQGNQNPQDLVFDEDELPPAVKKELEDLRKAQTETTSFITEQRQRQEQEAAEQQLNQLFSALRNAHGDFDEGYASYLMYQGVDPNEAVLKAKTLTQPQQQITQPNTQVPVVMGAGGGLPTQAVNPATMSDADRKNLVAQLVKQANEAEKEP